MPPMLAIIDLKDLGGPLLAMVIFGIVGILLMVLGFKIFDWITPKVDFQKELGDKNIAVGIVIGAIIIGVAIVIAAAMS